MTLRDLGWRQDIWIMLIGNQDETMGCDVALRDFVSSRGKVELNDLI